MRTCRGVPTATLPTVRRWRGAETGKITLSINSAFPSNAVNISGGTLDFNSRTDTIGALTLGGGASGSTASVTGTTGTLTLGGNITYDATNNPNGATMSGGTI